MYCGKCGAKNDDNDLFCTNCGQKLKNHDSTIKNNIATNPKENDELKKENDGPKKDHPYKKSTVWLDFISILWGIFGIYYVLMGFINLFNKNILDFSNSLISIITGIIYISALYFIHTRNKLGYYFFIYILTIYSTNILFNSIVSEYDNEYLLSYTIGAIIGTFLFYIPNILYIRKRKFLFLNEEENYYGEKFFYFILLLSLFISGAIFIFNINTI